MRRKFAIVFVLLCLAALVVDSLQAGSWRDGFKAAHAKALTFESWEPLYRWAGTCGKAHAMPLLVGVSTDLNGRHHWYVATYAGGYRDGCVDLRQQMDWIRTHRLPADPEHFYAFTVDFVRKQPLDRIIPPAHF